MTFTIDRRRLVLAGTAAFVAGAFQPAWAQDMRLRLIFWGSKDRADRTDGAANLFGKMTGVEVDS